MQKYLILCLSMVAMTQCQAAIRNFNTHINAGGIDEDALANPIEISIEIKQTSKVITAVPVKVYYGTLPHQIRGQWLIELYDVKRDQRLVCPLLSVHWLD